MITDIRKALDGIAETCGWREGDIRTKAFRHTYCAAARLQTLDHGAPVSLYTVAREMGHGGDALVRRAYGHLGEVRHRWDTVEFRIAQHSGRDGIRERLETLESGRESWTRRHADVSGLRARPSTRGCPEPRATESHEERTLSRLDQCAQAGQEQLARASWSGWRTA